VTSEILNLITKLFFTLQRFSCKLLFETFQA
jgi:hypothetical protein